jgi:uncharacterized protein (DUF169 family)
VNEFNRFGEELEKLMLLRTSPLAVKMLEKESDIPEGAIRPKTDRGYHFAQCQAFSLSRRKGQSIAMLRDDNWCWGPLIAYGLVNPGIAEQLPERRVFSGKCGCVHKGSGCGYQPMETAAVGVVRLARIQYPLWVLKNTNGLAGTIVV